MSTCISREGEYGEHEFGVGMICQRCHAKDDWTHAQELTTLREQVAAVEALADEWDQRFGQQVRTDALRAALASPGTALAKVRADALREVAEWLAGTWFPIDFNWPDDPPPAQLRAALIDVIHADADGRWHGGTLTRDETADWINGEAGWPDEQEVPA